MMKKYTIYLDNEPMFTVMADDEKEALTEALNTNLAEINGTITVRPG